MKKRLHFLAIIPILIVSHVLVLSNAIAINFDPEPSMSLSVNGDQNARIKSGEELEFVAKINKENISSQLVTWSWDTGNGMQTRTTNIIDNKVSTFVLNYDDVAAATTDENYIMMAEYADTEASLSAKVSFGVLGSNPAVIFAEPSFDTKVSINDPIHFKVKEFNGVGSTELHTEWVCGVGASFCPARDVKEGDISFGQTGIHEVSVIIKDQDGKEGREKITVDVVSDPPEIELQTDKSTDGYKTGDTAKFKVSAKDNYGTINKIEWGCAEGGTFSFNSNYLFGVPSKSIRDYEIDILLPDTVSNNYQCGVRVTDDDGEQNIATAILKISAPTPDTTPDSIDLINNTEANTTSEPNTVPDAFSPDTGVMARGNDFTSENFVVLIVSTLAILIVGTIVCKKIGVNKAQ